MRTSKYRADISKFTEDICDAMISQNTRVENLEPSNDMIKHFKSARTRYEDALKEKRAVKEKEELLSKCKALMEDGLKCKNWCFEGTITSLGSEADALYLQAENEQNFIFLTVAKSFKNAKETKEGKENIENKLKEEQYAHISYIMNNNNESIMIMTNADL